MPDQEYEVRKTGKNEYKVTAVPTAGCGAGCGVIGEVLIGFIIFLIIGNAIMDDGGAWVMSIIFNPIIAVPLGIILIVIFIVGLVITSD